MARKVGGNAQLRSHEHGIVIGLRVGTHRPREMKHGDGPVEYVQKVNVPVLRHYQARHNLGSYPRDRTAMNNANTVE